MLFLKFNVFGTLVAVEKGVTGWIPYYVGGEGKRRRADFEIPESIAEDSLRQYLADLFHEHASTAYPDTIQVR